MGEGKTPQKTDGETNALRRGPCFLSCPDPWMFLSTGLLLERISFPSQLHQGQHSLFARPKTQPQTREGRASLLLLAHKCRAAPFSSLRLPPAPALVSSSWVWPRGPCPPLCHSAGATLTNTPPQLENFGFPISEQFLLLWEQIFLHFCVCL